MSQKPYRLITLIVWIVLSVYQEAQAGPPLICHPYDIGNAKSLPWNGKEWRDIKTDYDLNRLADDTLALLTPDVPVIVRMETLRRAVIYSVWARYDKEVGYTVRDGKIANALLARLQDRAQAGEALAVFDAGYFVETWKNAAPRNETTTLPNGYAQVQKAIAMRNHDSAMEFAAAVIRYDDKAMQRAHLQKAVAGADANALLSRNLLLHFSDRGRDLAALRASLR
ncbi:MAG: hypothetical protein HOP19_12605 [Acidobacteria bacterium]|nr:hypothetical protein [Acidobacteriota bacterium]